MEARTIGLIDRVWGVPIHNCRVANGAHNAVSLYSWVYARSYSEAAGEFRRDLLRPAKGGFYLVYSGYCAPIIDTRDFPRFLPCGYVVVFMRACLSRSPLWYTLHYGYANGYAGDCVRFDRISVPLTSTCELWVLNVFEEVALRVSPLSCAWARKSGYLRRLLLRTRGPEWTSPLLIVLWLSCQVGDLVAS